MSTNLEYRERENRRQANEAQREKEWQRAKAEIKKQRRHFSWKNNMKSGGEKMRNVSDHQDENERQWKKEVNKNTYGISFIKRVTRKFLDVSRCIRAKQRQRYVQKIVLHVQSCFLLIRALLFFYRSRCLRRLASNDFIFCWSKV